MSEREQAADGWQPITTAPHGEDVLAFFPDAAEDTQIMICHFIKFDDDPSDEGDWYEQNVDRCPDPLPVQPTHWMPLPNVPARKVTTIPHRGVTR